MFLTKQVVPQAGKEAGSILPQCIAAVIASLAFTSAGCVLGWTSPTLPLLEESHYIVLTETDEAWISSIVSVGAALGPLLAGVLAAWWGHKVTLLFTAVLYVVGWSGVAVARCAELLYVARFVLGAATGISYTIPPTYISEISQAQIRGALASMSQMFASVGFVIVYVVGPWSSYVALAVTSGALAVLFLVGLFFIPDSPYQLLKRGKKDEARRAFLWLRGKTDSTDDKELQDIEDEIVEMLKQETSVMDLVANRATIKALMLSLGLGVLQQLSGINAVLFYAQKIFGMAVSSLQPSVATIIVGSVMLLAAAVTPFVVERAGRKMLLLLSAACMCLSEIVLGVFFYFTNKGTNVSEYGFVPTLSLVVYIVVFSLGLGPIMWTVTSELFAPIVKNKAASLTACTCWMTSFVVTFVFQDLVNSLGSHVVFWIFAACCAAAGVFVHLLLPETKGKTFREIQDLLEG